MANIVNQIRFKSTLEEDENHEVFLNINGDVVIKELEDHDFSTFICIPYQEWVQIVQFIKSQIQ